MAKPHFFMCSSNIKARRMAKSAGSCCGTWVKENPTWNRLPAIVPFVFYHGEREWKIPNEFLHLVDFEESWRPYLLDFRFPVLDLGAIPDRQLSEDRRLRARLLVMKYATRKRQQMAIKDFLREVLRGAPEDFRPIIHYLIAVYTYDEQTLREIIRSVQPEEEQMMMSQFAQDVRKQYAQEIEQAVREKVLQEGKQEGLQQGLQQGLQRGLQEGLLEGRMEGIQKGRMEGMLEGEMKGEARGEAKGEAKLLLRQLSRRFQPLPNRISERVYAASPDTIEIWADRVLEAKSLNEVFAE